jgi:DeoR family transcriptional regulator, catabolite repression regulator
MVEDGYIKAARLYDNELRDFVVVRAYLTPEGEAILAQMAPVPAAIPTPVAAPNPTAAVAETSSGPTDYGLVGESLQAIGTLIATLPTDWREIAEVYLDDLQNEINIAYRRRPIRIRAYFLALLRMMLPIVPHMPNGDEFLAQVRVVSGALGIPVKLPEN